MERQRDGGKSEVYNAIPENTLMPLDYGTVQFQDDAKSALYSIPQRGTARIHTKESKSLTSRPQKIPRPEVLDQVALKKAVKKEAIWKKVAFITTGISLFFLLAFQMLMTGEVEGSIIFFLALIPLAIVVVTTSWIGKWYPRPVWIRILAFCWGATASIIITFILGSIWQTFIPTDMLSAVAVQAPIIEEFAKGLFIVLVIFCFRKHLNNKIDGIVLAMLVGVGFAFTENLLYFTQALTDSGLTGLGLTFVMRGLLSPFAHAIFSLPMGLLAGLAIYNKRGQFKAVLGVLIGYVPAVILHALWNGGAYFTEADNVWEIFYLVIQFPIFVGVAVMIIRFRDKSHEETYRVLTKYGWLGWFNIQEINLYGTWEGRKVSKQWLKKQPPEAQQISSNLYKALEEIVYLEHSGDNKQEEIEKLLVTVQENRKVLASI